MLKYPKYGNILSLYEEANDIKEMTWQDITKVGLSNFIAYMQSEKSMAMNTIKTYSAMLKSILNVYSDEVSLPRYFAKILSVKGCVSQNTWLNNSEIQKLIAYEPENKTERLVRNHFVIGCLTGCRHSDIIKLSKNNIVDGMLVYVSQKTHIKAEVPITGVVERYLDDLEFVTQTICVNTFNSTIRRICKKCGINEVVKLFRGGVDVEGEKWQYISCHSSRRSFATNCYLSDLDLLSISKLCGHTDVSMTCHYICCGARLNDKVMQFFQQFE